MPGVDLMVMVVGLGSQDPEFKSCLAVELIPGGVDSTCDPSEVSKMSSGEDYRRRRERNNMAVKKSRIRSKEKAVETQQRVNELKEENERLEAKIQTLSKELTVLKELFLEHARGGASSEGSSDDGGNAVK
uniref:CCAAT/enhancer-binding protein gamma n=1 Tax=Eptatretus burgeri TaxID=7764 RepID=A0A8C4Q422_EPTBU